MAPGSSPDSSSRPMHAALQDWRAFGSRRYRRFRTLAVAQGFIGALSGPAVVLPLLLALGAHPALATLIAVLPVFGAAATVRFVAARVTELSRSPSRTDGEGPGIPPSPVGTGLAAGSGPTR